MQLTVKQMSSKRIGSKRISQKQISQAGFFMLEALVAILIFSLGILGLVAMGSVAINAQNDAQYRTEAANYASDIAGQILLSVDRLAVVTGTGNTTIVNPATLASFAHYASAPATTGTCAFGGAASTNPVVTAWVNSITSASSSHPLPGATAANLQITINQAATGFNQVAITVCWKAPSDLAMRRHTLISYIN